MPKEPERNPRKALGKGLSALLPRQGASLASNKLSTPALPDEPVEGALSPASNMDAPPQAPLPLPGNFEEFASIPLDHIRPGEDQPRNCFDLLKLHELGDSIKANGILQPITVYKTGPNEYRLIAGERRWRAAGIAGLTEIPALVRNVEQQARVELALIENIQREDLNAIEIATAFYALSQQHGLSHEQIAERTGKERTTVTNYLRLLRLGSIARNAVTNGEISMGHARVLVGITDERTQGRICEQIIAEDLSVRATEKIVKDLTNPKDNRTGVEGSPSKTAKQGGENASDALDPNLRAALDAISAALGTKVTLHAKNANAGRLEIEYYSQEDLDRIYSVIVE